MQQWANLHQIRLIELPANASPSDTLGHFIADQLRQRPQALYQIWFIMLAGTLAGILLAIVYFRYKKAQN